MATTLQFTDGTTTVDITSGASGYGLLHGAWSPQVARRRRGQLGGNPYENVVETMEITIEGSSPTNLLSNLQTLIELFDQANRWGQRENVTAVQFKYKPDTSSTTVLSPIWNAEVILPDDLTALGGSRGNKLGDLRNPVTLRFTRLGLWLAGTEAEASSTSTGNPSILTSSTFTDTAAIPWPYDVEIDISAVTNGVDNDVIAMFHNGATKLYFAEAESLTLSTDTSSQVLSGSSAGSVARCDSDSTSQATHTITDSSPGMATGGRLYQFYCVAKNNSTSGAASVEWDMALRVSFANEFMDGPTTRLTFGEGIKIVDLGVFAIPADLSAIQVRAGRTKDGTTNTDDLDVDYICGIELSDAARIISTNFTVPAAAAGELHIDHRLDTKINPIIYTSDSGDTTQYEYPPYSGTPIMMADGNALSCLIFGINGTGGDWVIGTGGEANLTLNVTRTLSYLAPV